jgi:hypothetical protein
MYFFDIVDAFPSIPCKGTDLGSLAAARRHALEYAGQALTDQLPSFWNDDEWTMTVSDERHLTLFTITISTRDSAAITPYRHFGSAH